MVKLLLHCFNRNVKRISRYHYWMAVCIVLFLFYALDLLLLWLFKISSMSEFMLPVFLGIIPKACILFILCLKRFHDVGYSVSRLLLYTFLSLAIIGIVLIFIVTLKKSDQANAWGEAEGDNIRLNVQGRAVICTLAVLVVSGMVFSYLKFFAGNVRNAEVRLNESVKYSSEELTDAVDTLKRHLFFTMSGCELQKITYREWMESSLTESERVEAGIGQDDDYIILETQSVVKYDLLPGFSGGASFKGNKDDIRWLLVHNKKSGKWRVAGALGEG